MLRLSIIVPYRKNDQRLEDTLLSVLENRPKDCEVIVVDDGSYDDPYELFDEVVFVREQPQATLPQLLNAGLMAAEAPIVCVLMDGVTATPNWTDPAMRHFANPNVAAVAPALSNGSAQSNCTYGIDSKCTASAVQMRHSVVEAQRPNRSIAPSLAAGFYRRKLLLAIEGWSEELSCDTVDVELAMLFQHLGLNCQCEVNSQVLCKDKTILRQTTPQGTHELASLCAANGLAEYHWLAGLQQTTLGLFTGKLAIARAWQSGLQDESLVAEINGRLEFAKQSVASTVANQQPLLRAA